MNDPQCEQARAATAELALGILGERESAALGGHLAGCEECRAEVEDFRWIGRRLWDVLPDAEAPLGFDQRVISRIPPRPYARRRTLGIRVTAVVAAAAAVAVTAVALSAGHRTGTETAGPLRAGDRTVGSVYTDGRPAWVWMKIQGSGLSGRLTCVLIAPDGSRRPLGSFDVVAGSGSWAAPEPAGSRPPVEADLVDQAGRTVARAQLRPA